jgi:2'-hydroxyisoflavone reductase
MESKSEDTGKMCFQKIMENKKILVLGGTRFIGESFTQTIIKSGYDVYLTSRKVNNSVDPKKQENIEREEIQNGKIFTNSFDCIFDFNGYKPDQIFEFKLKNENSKYVFISSDWIGREPLLNPTTVESSVVGKLDPISYEYTLNKTACENKVKKIFTEQAVIARIPIIIGKKDPHQRLQYMIKRMLKNKKIYVPTINDNGIQFSFAKDIVKTLKSFVDYKSNSTKDINFQKLRYVSYIEIMDEIRLAIQSDNTFIHLSESEYLKEFPLTASADPFWREKYSNESANISTKSNTYRTKLSEIISDCSPQSNLHQKYKDAIEEENAYAFPR